MNKDPAGKIRIEKLTLIVLAVSALVFIALFMWARPEKSEPLEASEYVEYEKAEVTGILSDNTEIDPASDNAYRGEQLLTAIVKTGRYKDEELLVYNYTGPLYGVPVSEGDSIIISISTHADGQHNAVVYEYNRIPALAIVIIIFCIFTVLIGGKTGLKSLIGLLFTILCLFTILIPMLLKGAPTLPATFLMCAYISLVSFVILGGVHRKTISAFLGR